MNKRAQLELQLVNITLEADELQTLIAHHRERVPEHELFQGHLTAIQTAAHKARKLIGD